MVVLGDRNGDVDKINVEERIVEYFRSTRGVFICDRCLANELRLGSGANKTMARNATSVLGAVHEYFEREPGTCPHCQNERLVTRWRR